MHTFECLITRDLEKKKKRIRICGLVGVGVTLLDEVSLRLGFEISDVEASECRTLSYLSSTMFACLPPW
jgi:cytochrome c-type biogenesis protein CcmE